jgi:hypothetical protein
MPGGGCVKRLLAAGKRITAFELPAGELDGLKASQDSAWM